MGKGWLVDGKWLGPPRSGGQGDREAQTRRQNEKRKMQRMAAREAAGKPKSKGGRTPGSHSKQQCQKAAWMIRRRLHGKQPPLGLTAFARGAHAKAIRSSLSVTDDASGQARHS